MREDPEKSYVQHSWQPAVAAEGKETRSSADHNLNRQQEEIPLSAAHGGHRPGNKMSAPRVVSPLGLERVGFLLEYFIISRVSGQAI
jgi:hypothetical protein